MTLDRNRNSAETSEDLDSGHARAGSANGSPAASVSRDDLAKVRELIALQAAARKAEHRRYEAEIKALRAEIAALKARRPIDLILSALGFPIGKWRARLRIWREMREVRKSGLFDADWYTARYGDVARSGIDPLLHYVRYGGFEGRDPNPDFDSDWYRRMYGDVIGDDVNPLIDYIRSGSERDPSPLFSTSWYLREYSDVAKSGLHPLVHFQRYGRREGRVPVPVGR
jgi:hypothetical protein